MCTSALQQDPGKYDHTKFPGGITAKKEDKKPDKKDEKQSKDKGSTGPGPGSYKPIEYHNMKFYSAASKDKMSKSTRAGPKVDPKTLTPGAGAYDIKQEHLEKICGPPKNSLSGFSRKGLY